MKCADFSKGQPLDDFPLVFSSLAPARLVRLLRQAARQMYAKSLRRKDKSILAGH